MLSAICSVLLFSWRIVSAWCRRILISDKYTFKYKKKRIVLLDKQLIICAINSNTVNTVISTSDLFDKFITRSRCFEKKKQSTCGDDVSFHLCYVHSPILVLCYWPQSCRTHTTNLNRLSFTCAFYLSEHYWVVNHHIAGHRAVDTLVIVTSRVLARIRCNCDFGELCACDCVADLWLTHLTNKLNWFRYSVNQLNTK